MTRRYVAHLGAGTTGHEFADQVVIQLARQGLLDDRWERVADRPVAVFVDAGDIVPLADS